MNFNPITPLDTLAQLNNYQVFKSEITKRSNLAWQNINSGLYTSLNPWNDIRGKHFYLVKDNDTFLKRQHSLY